MKNNIFVMLFCAMFLMAVSPAYPATIEDIRNKMKMGESSEGESALELKLDGQPGLKELREGVVYVPSRYDPKKPMPAILLLKWYDGWPMQITEIWMGHAEDRNYILIAPGSSGRAWNTGEKGKIMRLFFAVAKKYRIDSKNVMLFGHSNGAQMALRVGLQQQKFFKGIVLCACNFEKAVRSYGAPQFTKDKKSQPKIYIIQGGADETTPPAKGRMTRDELQKYNYDVVYNEIEGLGHVIPDYQLYPILDWFESFKYRE